MTKIICRLINAGVTLALVNEVRKHYEKKAKEKHVTNIIIFEVKE